MAVPVNVRLAGASEAAGAAVTFGLPMNAARSSSSVDENRPVNRLPMPPRLLAIALAITDGWLAARVMPLTLAAGEAPWHDAQLAPPVTGPLRYKFLPLSASAAPACGAAAAAPMINTAPAIRPANPVPIVPPMPVLLK